MYNSAVGERQHPDQRRQSLLEATARCLAARGAAGVSVRAICAEAAVSPGLLRHYFAGVSDAIAETYRWTVIERRYLPLIELSEVGER